MTKAADVMSPLLLSLTPDMPARAAQVLLFEYGFAAVPVVDAAKVVGIVSARDLLPARVSGSDIDLGSTGCAAGVNGRDGGVIVADVMVTPVVTMPTTATTTELAAAMLASGQGSMPIVDDDGNLVGMVSRIELMHLVGTRPRRGRWPGTAHAACSHRAADLAGL